VVRGGVAASLRLLLLIVLLVGSALAAAGARNGDERVKSGTGFFVSRDGFLATSAHVVSGCRHLSIWEPDRSESAAYVIASDRHLDLALLWVEGGRARPAAVVAARAPLRPGEAVFTLGFGVIATEPLQPVPVEGTFVDNSTAQSGNRVLAIRATLHAGHSGGALLAADGSLVGMIIGRDEHRDEIGVAMPKEDIEPLLAAYGIQLANQSRPADPRDLLAAISALVQCSAGAPEPRQ
jgi:S1-C subfamily serine protease